MNYLDETVTKNLDEFMEYYKVVDTEEIYSNGTEFVPIFRVKQWEEYNNKDKEIERLNMRLKTSNDTCNYLRNIIDKAIFFIQNQELHKSKDTTGAITMKERELMDILLGGNKSEYK